MGNCCSSASKTLANEKRIQNKTVHWPPTPQLLSEHSITPRDSRDFSMPPNQPLYRSEYMVQRAQKKAEEFQRKQREGTYRAKDTIRKAEEALSRGLSAHSAADEDAQYFYYDHRREQQYLKEQLRRDAEDRQRQEQARMKQMRLDAEERQRVMKRNYDEKRRQRVQEQKAALRATYIQRKTVSDNQYVAPAPAMPGAWSTTWW